MFQCLYFIIYECFRSHAILNHEHTISTRYTAVAT